MALGVLSHGLHSLPSGMHTAMEASDGYQACVQLEGLAPSTHIPVSVSHDNLGWYLMPTQ